MEQKASEEAKSNISTSSAMSASQKCKTRSDGTRARVASRTAFGRAADGRESERGVSRSGSQILVFARAESRAAGRPGAGGGSSHIFRLRVPDRVLLCTVGKTGSPTVYVHCIHKYGFAGAGCAAATLFSQVVCMLFLLLVKNLNRRRYHLDGAHKN